jgi:two-component system sensor histidine kinase VanS
MLKKVLSNVILNAVQNSPSGAEIRIWCEQADRHYILCVLNTGTQIDEWQLAKLTDPFFRLDDARNHKRGRSGLGLTIVHKTLAAMDIPFALENSDEGVLFWMELAKYE